MIPVLQLSKIIAHFRDVGKQVCTIVSDADPSDGSLSEFCGDADPLDGSLSETTLCGSRQFVLSLRQFRNGFLGSFALLRGVGAAALAHKGRRTRSALDTSPSLVDSEEPMPRWERTDGCRGGNGPRWV